MAVNPDAPAAGDFNEHNVYNHNFRGVYCRCEGTYAETDTMVQCVRCEDWFHDRCMEVVRFV